MILAKREKILIIDDEMSILNSIAGLADALGYSPIAIDKPAEAVEIIKRLPDKTSRNN